MMRAEEAARALSLNDRFGIVLIHLAHIISSPTFNHHTTILMETSNSNSESEKVKSQPPRYDPVTKTLTISRLVEEPITLSKAETDTWSFSITVPGRGIIEGIHWKDLKSSVRTLVVKGEVESIGEDVFSNCPSLENVELSSSLQSIGDNAFQKCNTLRRIRIPAGVTRLGTSVFYECDDLEEIESESLRYPAEDGVLFKVADDGKRILVRYPSNRKGKHYTIPKDVVEIEEYAFAKCRNLKSITIPETVGKIGYGVFDACGETFVIYSNLGAITVSSNLETIIVSWLCPPKEIDSHIFGCITNPSKIRLIVPEGSKSAYCKEDQVWENCEVIEEGDEGI